MDITLIHHCMLNGLIYICIRINHKEVLIKFSLAYTSPWRSYAYTRRLLKFNFVIGYACLLTVECLYNCIHATRILYV